LRAERGGFVYHRQEYARRYPPVGVEDRLRRALLEERVDFSRRQHVAGVAVLGDERGLERVGRLLAHPFVGGGALKEAVAERALCQYHRERLAPLYAEVDDVAVGDRARHVVAHLPALLGGRQVAGEAHRARLQTRYKVAPFEDGHLDVQPEQPRHVAADVRGEPADLPVAALKRLHALGDAVDKDAVLVLAAQRLYGRDILVGYARYLPVAFERRRIAMSDRLLPPSAVGVGGEEGERGKRGGKRQERKAPGARRPARGDNGGNRFNFFRHQSDLINVFKIC